MSILFILNISLTWGATNSELCSEFPVYHYPISSKTPHTLDNIESFTISGYLRDSETGEALIGANVYVKELLKGTTTNVYGFYSLTLSSDSYTLVFSYMGYIDKSQQINLNGNLRINSSLEPIVIETEEVVITGEAPDKNTESTEMGTVNINVENIRNLPVLFGELDVLKTIQLLPGVSAGGEGNSGFYVRGGGPDQNLVLLDDAVVYNPGHLFGFFSVFNSDAINSVTLIKGGMPANYGGRLSSVLDITMNEGNMKKYSMEGGIGLISSRLTVQGPIKVDTSSFMISGRRTYVDVLVKPYFSGTKYEGSGYYFYDLNAKLNYKFSDKNRLYFSGYFGRDIFNFEGGSSRRFSTKIPWGNATTTLRWNHLFTDKLFMNTSIVYNDYNFEITTGFENWKLNLFSGIIDANVKVDFEYYPKIRNKFKFGVDYIFHTFIPSSASATSDDDVELVTDKVKKKYAHEGALYALYDFDITEKLKLNIGLRGSAFQQVGPYEHVSYNEKGFVQDTIQSYEFLEPVKTYYGLEPRTSLRFNLAKSSSIKASYTVNNQYIHLVSNSSQTLPTDIWTPSSMLVEPQRAVQYAFGFFQNFKDDTYETSAEIYYKEMDNQIEYKDGFTPDLNVDLENSFAFGTGEAYGLELFIKKRSGKFNGWIGYTLSRTLRRFETLKDKEFPARYDRTHDASIVLSYQLNKKWSFGATFVYGTGSTVTLPIQSYVIQGELVNEYGARNSFRMEPYHRLDVSAVRKGKSSKKFESSWVFSVYNVYNRKNPFFYYIDAEGDPLEGTVNIQAKKVYLFPILPSVAWNFKF